MKKITTILIAIVFIASSVMLSPVKTAKALAQTTITRSQAEARALNMINLSWTYTKTKNSNIAANYSSNVTQPQQLNGVTTAQETGIPYNWGGLDGLDSSSLNAPWTGFLDAISKGAYAGNVNAGAYGYIPGTAGLDCSGFVQAVFNIKDYKQSTSTLFNTYFTKINMSDLKHMDILDKPGDHVVIFDKWGTMNGLNGAYTYEATPDQYYGGIQGTKHYFISMTTINTGYIPGKYVNITEDAPLPYPVPKGVFAQVSKSNTLVNLRASASSDASIIGTVPGGTILYMADYSAGWYKVNVDGKTGWIYGGLINPIPSGKYVTVNNVSALNIRNNPSLTSQIIETLTQGQYAEVLGYSTDGKWLNISINGIQGWSSAQYLSYIY